MISAARRIAFDVLRRVEAQGGFAADLLHQQLGKTIKREDASLATELTLGVLRSQRLLDFLIQEQARRPVEDLDLEALLALRLGLYQMRYLTRVPPSAAVNESVELVKQSRKSSAAGLVNAVLRGLLRRGPRVNVEELLPADCAPAERLGILHSHPTWMVERWLARTGEEATTQLLEANNRPARSACAVHDPAQLARVEESLRAAGIVTQPARWLASARYVHGGNVVATEAYQRGWISLQDEASQMVPLLLDVRPGQRVLDLCAAPGGKTVPLIRAAGGAQYVVAADLHLHRLLVLREQLARIGIQDLRMVALDAERTLPFQMILGGTFDRVLVDAPCSGTGTLDRNPEIRWRLKPEDLPALRAKQTALLAHALEHLAPGGRLIYSTCSLEPEENEEVLDAALEQIERGGKEGGPEGAARAGRGAKSGAEILAPFLAAGARVEELFDSEGIFRTLPHVHGTNGFFAAAVDRQRPGSR
ncbi:MAG: 16S rRNA (cytosine(967)-C(5))-methyltransferase RsmB [Acidipila sp.]|nr:16S rRNA (cytosine(967)-C(5))-methyltransferase RsmB [Acidipila sp.]